MANLFCSLPQELKVEILTNFDAVSLVSCVMTCTAMYAAFKSSSLLAYTIQLHLHGLKDAGTSMSPLVLMESLIRQRQAWLALEVDKPLTRQTQPTCYLYDLAGGAFAHISSGGYGNRCFEISWLPTARNADASGCTLRTPSIEIMAARDFTMDPTQDLILFFEDDWDGPASTTGRHSPHIPSLHIRTISTNTIHPEAQKRALEVINGPGGNQPVDFHFTELQIAHNVVAIRIRNNEREMRAMVWDWTTSDLILDTATSFDPNLPSFAYDFVLLNSTYFFIATEGTFGAIRLYKLARRSYVAGTQAVHLATLHLPPLSSGVTIRGIISHAGPIEANPRADTPFMPDNDDRLHMFTVKYRRVTPNSTFVHGVHLFFHQRVLLKYARHACGAPEPLNVPWAEWGPPNTSVALSAPRRFDGRRCVYGQRAISKQYKSSRMEEPQHAVDVFDFSLAAVLAAQGVPDTPLTTASATGNPGRLLPSSTIRTADFPFFLDDVETHLPCVVSTIYLTQSYSSYMIYADGIIGVNNTSHGGYVMDIYPI